MNLVPRKPRDREPMLARSWDQVDRAIDRLFQDPDDFEWPDEVPWSSAPEVDDEIVRPDDEIDARAEARGTRDVEPSRAERGPGGPSKRSTP